MVIAKATPALGYVAFMVEMPPGESHEITINSLFGIYENGMYYLTEGECTSVDKETGRELPVKGKGWLSIDHPNENLTEKGTIVATTVDGCKWVCIPRSHNKRLPSYIKPIIFSRKKKFINNSNLFLVSGEVTVNTVTFTAPAQIRIRSGDSYIIPKGEVQILEFPSD
jgi:hypothetical protein